MRSFVVIAALVLLIDTSTASFYGANSKLPQSEKLTSGLNKCRKAIEPVNKNLCKTQKTTLKFNNQKYESAANALVDLQYVFSDIDEFYSSFLNCLNDQNDTVTAVTTIRNLEILIYQIDVYVVTGIEQKLSASADVLGQVFGEKTRNVLTTISDTLREEFSKVKTNLETIRASFQAIADSGSEITEESINSTLSSSAFTEMIASFSTIETTTTQASGVFESFAVVTETLNVVTGSVQATRASSTTLVSRTQYNLDISSQSSKKMNLDNLLKNQANMEAQFETFYSLAALQFTGDEQVQESRSQIELFVGEITTFFDEVGKRFTTFVTERVQDYSTEIRIMRENINVKTKEVTDFLAEAVADNSGSYSKCLAADSNNTKMATALIQSFGTNTSLCIAQQTNVTMKAAYVINYVNEDVILNFNGTSDRLCSCLVKGDKTVEERAKRCLKRRIDEMSTQVSEDKEYLSNEIQAVENEARQSYETFRSCTFNVTETFTADFEKLKTAVKACTAV